jgi:hypothetical protein
MVGFVCKLEIVMLCVFVWSVVICGVWFDGVVTRYRRTEGAERFDEGVCSPEMEGQGPAT